MTEARIERRLAAIVCADVVGYSRLVGADESGTIAAWKAHRDAILPIATAYRGRLVGTQGDGLLFEYASVVDAVAAALVIQQTMATRGAAEPENRRFRLRIGINLGDIIVEGSDILGDGVNVAARLEALAEPGTVCVSGVVREQVLGKLPVEFDDLGPRSVKNIDRAVHAWRARPAGSVPPANTPSPARPTDTARPRLRGVAIAFAAVLVMLGVTATGTWLADVWPWNTAQRPAGVAIMVLPFESPAGQGQEYLSDGITEDIITALSKMAALANRQNLYVIGRSTAFTYKGRKIDARRLARDLSVTHLLVGSVRRDGDRLRISAELIDAWTGRSNWAERYDRGTGAVFDIQDDVTSKVVGRLMAVLETPSGSGDTNPLRPGGGPSVADNSPEAVRRRQEAEARARAAEERRRAQDAPRPQREPSPMPPPPAPSPPSDPAPSAAAPTPPPSSAPAQPRRPLRPAPATVPRTKPTPVMRPAPEVYDLVLQARMLAGKDARPPLMEARTLLLRAVEMEPRYMPAQLTLAGTYLSTYARGWSETDGTPAELEAALRRIDSVLAMTEESPMSWAMRAVTLAHLGRHDDAREAADRVANARDADAASLDRAAQAWTFLGGPDTALALLARARKVDPMASSAALATQARAEFLLGRDAAAVKTTETCLARNAGERDCLEIAAAALARLDKLDAARGMVAKMRALDPDYTAETPRTRFARSYQRHTDVDALVAALRRAMP